MQNKMFSTAHNGKSNIFMLGIPLNAYSQASARHVMLGHILGPLVCKDLKPVTVCCSLSNHILSRKLQFKDGGMGYGVWDMGYTGGPWQGLSPP